MLVGLMGGVLFLWLLLDLSDGFFLRPERRGIYTKI